MGKNNSKPLLKIQNISKSFPGVQALDNVTLEVYPGKINSLVGENGAGKSTLMKILTGVYEPDSGKIALNNDVFNVIDPKMARSMNISVVYQETNLVNTLSIAENLFLNNLPVKDKTIGWVDWKKLFEDADHVLQKLDLKLNPKTLVSKLSSAQKQMVEISKSLTENSKILILDEPTSCLSVDETEKLFDVLKILKSNNVAIIFISHRLEEVFNISDYINILRDGKFIKCLSAEEFDKEKVIELMVGRSIDKLYPRTQLLHENPDQVLLEVEKINEGECLNNIHFILKKGEILGFGGLEGCGRSELVRAIFGADNVETRKIKINGKEVKISKPFDAIKHGIGFISEDRHKDGLFLKASVKTNITFPVLDRLCHYFGWINKKNEKTLATKYVDRLSIATSTIEKLVSLLSGGNQQKVILARWLATNPQILIMDEPTKGVDVGAKTEIHKIIDELSHLGLGIILISSELPELMGMSDRIYVLNCGSISGEYERSQFSQEKILNSSI